MNNLKYLLILLLTFQVSFSQAEVTGSDSEEYALPAFEQNRAIDRAEQLLEEGNGSRSNAFRELMTLALRAKLRWHQLAMFHAGECQGHMTPDIYERCYEANFALKLLRGTLHEIKNSIIALPGIGAAGLAVATSRWLSSKVSESGLGRVVHTIGNRWVVSSGVGAVGAWAYVRRLQRLPEEEQQQISRELNLAINALEVTDRWTVTGVADLMRVEAVRSPESMRIFSRYRNHSAVNAIDELYGRVFAGDQSQ